MKYEADAYKMAKISSIAEIENKNLPWSTVLHLGRNAFYPKNTIIPHMESNCFYYLTKGKVIISYCTVDGLERVALFIKPGCIFNEARSLSSYKPFCQFCCVAPSDVVMFDKKLLHDEAFVTKYPKLIMNLLSSMGTKMLIHYAYLSEMGVEAPAVLLARFILGLIKKNGGALEFPLGMTQQNVANLFGVHRATLARAIKELQSTHIITTFTSKRVVVHDFQMLCQLAGQQ